MKNKHHIEKQVDETLNSLDGIQRASSNPFLFTRIKEQLNRKEKGAWGFATRVITRPVFAITAVVIIVLINVAIFSQKQPDSVQTTTTQDGEQLFASEYNLGSSTLYDENMDQQ